MAESRPPRILGAVFFAMLVAGISLAPAASSAPPPAMALDDAGPFRPGHCVTVTWEPLPADTEEFELLLRFESPVVLTLRLTESRDPRLTATSLRVPGIPCDRARLLLRHGRGGRETTWAQSPPFAIEGDRSGPLPRLEMRSGEYWLADGAADGLYPHGNGGFRHSPGAGEEPCEVQASHRDPSEITGAGTAPRPGPVEDQYTGRNGRATPVFPVPLRLRI